MNEWTSYERLLNDVMENGSDAIDRTGVGTRSVFGRQIRFDLSKGFPLVTTKKVFTRGVFAELLWFLDGDTSEHTLRDQNVNIWKEWAAEDGQLGPVYGAQWRTWGAHSGLEPVDQITQLVEGLRNDPFSRRHIVNAWNVSEIKDMALAPCHTMFQFDVTPDEDGKPWKLNCQLYQRSADLFLGVPFNIASYAALVHVIADQVGLQVGDFVHTFGNAHIYMNHFDQVREQLSRTPRPFPQLVVERRSSVFDHVLEDFAVLGYDPHPAIRGEVAV